MVEIGIVLDVIEHDDGIHQTTVFVGTDGKCFSRVEKIYVPEACECDEDIPY